MALIDKLTAIADSIRGKTGGTDALSFDQMAAAISAIETGGGGAKVTEYIVTEDTDRSLWFNAVGIKLVKGLNLLVIGDTVDVSGVVNNRSGLIVLCLILWDGTPITNKKPDTLSPDSNITGFHSVSNAWSRTLGSSNQGLCSGGTTGLSVGEDGLLTFTTSATGVTTGNYANSFFGAGNTYYLLQAESEVVC